ncbi:MAG: hypothetical protein C4525_00565 [Desulfarculus sp.]|nr:MAG: hypothetical protein C4525_00565 [Desulfarculus sp.]
MYLYASVGVCHQLANRGLFSTGTTVKEARGYGLSHFFFGTYGFASIKAEESDFSVFGAENTGNASYDMKQCLAQAPPSMRTREAVDREAELFLAFLRNVRSRSLQSSQPDFQLAYESYRKDSLGWRLEDTLGPQPAEQLRGRVNELWSRVQSRKSALFREHFSAMMRFRRIPSEYWQGMNNLLRDAQRGLRSFLTPEQYRKFVNLPYPDREELLVTWRDFMDRRARALIPE